ncbi:MAG TPA: glycosyltransferase family 1 protein [Anaerolineales bacterium]|nr:glycosyltransferase family 1 protein [Anaerolineales bacterium]
MDLKLTVNARYQHRRIAGVDRYAHEISRRLNMQKRFIKPNRPLGQVAGHLWEQFVLPRLVEKDEILWSPANSGAWSVANQVVTIHDASVFDHPEWFRPAFAAWTRLSWKVLARRAKAVITVSEFSKQRLQYFLKIPDGKIHVVYNGVGEPFKPQSQKQINEVKKKYDLNKSYFLFVGTLEPRKNLKALLEAWKLLNSKTHELFMSGGEGHVFPQPKLQIANSKYIPDEDLPAMYAGATAFVFPSLYEGFGLPILEAMACGTPVIASDIEVFREIYGDTIMFANPRKPQEIADAMKTMIEDQSLSENLRQRGFQKAAQLSWDESARKTQAVIESIP